MKEALAPLAGTIVGGLIATGTTVFTNYGTYQKDYQTERRQKLETVIADVFDADACTNRMIQGETVNEACEAGTAGYQSMAYTKMYFPDLYPSVSAFQVMHAKLRKKMLECMSMEKSFDALSQAQRRLLCLDENFKDPMRKEGQIDAIVNKAREVELTIAPQPSVFHGLLGSK